MSDKQIRVVQVIDHSTVVLNIGTREDAAAGDKFLIYGEGPEIMDPETGENLGVVELVRGRVKITHVQEKLSTASSIEVSRAPARKRVIKRDPWQRALLGQSEEITEESQVTEEPLNHPEVGDLARPI